MIFADIDGDKYVDFVVGVGVGVQTRRILAPIRTFRPSGSRRAFLPLRVFPPKSRQMWILFSGLLASI